MSISASLYTTYQRCPGHALGQMQGRYGPESRASFSGMLAHRIFARHLTTGPIAPDGFAAACRQEIGQALNGKLGALQMRPSELRGVIAEVGELYTRFQAVSAGGIRFVEAELEVTVSPDVRLRGRIDAVFADGGGVRLVDWKTGRLDGAADQLDFYALLWALDRGELPTVVEAASVVSGEKYATTPDVRSVRSTSQRVVEMVAELRAGLGGGAASRRGGPWCRFCPLRRECAEGVAALRVLSA